MKRLLYLACALALAACEVPLLAGGSSSTETGKKVHLMGRVAAANGEGIPGVAVSLSGGTLADTTDVSGAYRISGRKTGKGPDTLTFSVHGRAIVRRALTGLQDSLPELRLVQRGFSGALSPGGLPVTRIEGIVTGDGIAPGDSVTALFHHNVAAGNYSGFIYFPAPGDTIRHYSVRVEFFGEGDVFLGRSAEVAFTSLSGNVTIPDQSLHRTLNKGPGAVR